MGYIYAQSYQGPQKAPVSSITHWFFPLQTFPLLPNATPQHALTQALLFQSLAKCSLHCWRPGDCSAPWAELTFLHLSLYGKTLWCVREPGLPAWLLPQCLLTHPAPDPVISPWQELLLLLPGPGLCCSCLFSLCLHLPSCSLGDKEENCAWVWSSNSLRQT